MSDLADAVFGGQLLGHVVAGDEITPALISEVEIVTDLATHMTVDNHMAPEEFQVLQAKVASHTVSEGEYDPSDITSDQFDVDLAGPWI
jgi:hypothetical protein